MTESAISSASQSEIAPSTPMARRILVAGVGVVLLIALATGLVLNEFRERETAIALTNLDRFNLVLADQTAHAIQSVELILRHTRATLDKASPAQRRDDTYLHGLMSEAIAGIPQIYGMFINDADGVGISSSFRYPSTRPDLSGRSYHLHHSQTPDDQIYISEPVKIVGTGTWAITLSLRMRTPDDRFDGVLAVAVSTDYFTRLFESINRGTGIATTLFRVGNVLLVRYPLLEESLGRTIPPSNRTQRFWAQDQKHTSNRMFGPVSQSEVFVDCRWVPGFPLATCLSLPVEKVEEPWRSHAYTLGGITAGICMLILAIFAALARSAAGRERGQQSLREARATAESANQAKSRFLAMMSHELRTPMTGVIGMADLLLKTALTTQQRQYLTILRSSASSLMVILNDILDFSKIEAGQMAVERIAFFLPAVIEETVAVLRPAAAHKNLLLIADISPDTPQAVIGDPNRLRQVLFNLIGNAIKFTEHGSITLTVTVPALPAPGTPILSTAGCPPDETMAGETHPVRFEIADTGVGLSEGQLETLFRPFNQADVPSTGRRFGGTGLGLVISKRLIELMGGTIGADGRVGIGATFWFSVPFGKPAAGDTGTGIAEPPASPTSQPLEPAQAAAPARQLRILVAEDNPVNQLLVKAGLENQGHLVTVADNGQQALEAVIAAGSEARYDVVLMDMQMPVMDGIEATVRIRALPHPIGLVPVVAITADAIPDHRGRYMAAGLDDFITKPIDWAALNRILARVTMPEVASSSPEADALQAFVAGIPTSLPTRNEKMPFASAAEAISAPVVAPISMAEETRSAYWREPLFDLVMIEQCRAFMSEAEIEGVFALLPGSSRDSGKQIKAAYASRDWVALATAAHTLKGMVANVGAARLAAVAKELQLQARAGAVELPLLADFDLVMEETLAEVSALMPK